MSEETKENKNNCIIIPEHMKALVECCQEYDQGKIESGDFFAKALMRTGEFMQEVQKRRSEQPIPAEAGEGGE